VVVVVVVVVVWSFGAAIKMKNCDTVDHWLAANINFIPSAVLYLYFSCSAHWYLVVICFPGLREPVANDTEMAEKEMELSAAAVSVCCYIRLLSKLSAVSQLYRKSVMTSVYFLCGFGCLIEDHK